MNKSMIILDMYDDLVEGRLVSAEDCCVKYDISISSFYRYLTTVREYIRVRRNHTLKYDKKTKAYRYADTILSSGEEE